MFLLRSKYFSSKQTKHKNKKPNTYFYRFYYSEFLSMFYVKVIGQPGERTQKKYFENFKGNYNFI